MRLEKAAELGLLSGGKYRDKYNWLNSLIIWVIKKKKRKIIGTWNLSSLHYCWQPIVQHSQYIVANICWLKNERYINEHGLQISQALSLLGQKQNWHNYQNANEKIRESDGVYLIFKTKTLGTDRGSTSQTVWHACNLRTRSSTHQLEEKERKVKHFRQHLPQNRIQLIHLRHEYHRKFQKDKKQNYFYLPNECLPKSTKST